MRPGGLARGLRRPDTRANVELSVVFGVLSLRAFDLIQGAFAMVTGSLAASTNPGLELAVFLLLAVESMLLGAWLAKRRSVQPCTWPIMADFGLALVTVGLVPAYISRRQLGPVHRGGQRTRVSGIRPAVISVCSFRAPARHCR